MSSGRGAVPQMHVRTVRWPGGCCGCGCGFLVLLLAVTFAISAANSELFTLPESVSGAVGMVLRFLVAVSCLAVCGLPIAAVVLALVLIRRRRRAPPPIRYRPRGAAIMPASPQSQLLQRHQAELHSGRWGEVIAAWFDAPEPRDQPWEPCAVVQQGTAYVVLRENTGAWPRDFEEDSRYTELGAAYHRVAQLRPWRLDPSWGRAPTLDQWAQWRERYTGWRLDDYRA